jgi:hypothetical protein
MSYSNGEIYGNISINDIQRAIGNSSPDLGTLIRTGNINKWARYKPVSYPGVDKVRSRDIRSHGLPFTPDTYFDGLTGLSFSSMIDTPSSVAGYDDIEISYIRPTGGQNSPYRDTDFSGYNHNAQKPAEIYFGSTFKLDRGMSCRVTIYDRSSADEQSYISFSDFINDSSFASADKRLCLAVYDVAVSDNAPIWYFFSEKFSSVGSSGTWDVGTNMFNTNFTQLLTIGKSYKFQVMVVTNHSYLEQVIPNTDRYRWEYGVSPSEMSSMESGSGAMKAMCLAFENGMDRCVRALQNSSVVTDRSYYLGMLSVEKYGEIVYDGNYQKLCTCLYLPAIIIRSRTALSSSDQYQMRVRFSQGVSSSTIFQPIDKSGNNYYEIASTPSTQMSEIPITSWHTIATVIQEGLHTTDTDGAGNTVQVYEFDFPNHTYVITSNTAPQTLGQAGLFLFFDQENDFTITFTLYYRPNTSQAETLVRTLTINYSVSEGIGYIADQEWT